MKLRKYLIDCAMSASSVISSHLGSLKTVPSSPLPLTIIVELSSSNSSFLLPVVLSSRNQKFNLDSIFVINCNIVKQNNKGSSESFFSKYVYQKKL